MVPKVLFWQAISEKKNYSFLKTMKDPQVFNQNQPRPKP